LNENQQDRSRVGDDLVKGLPKFPRAAPANLEVK